jgi:hypothetical protein
MLMVHVLPTVHVVLTQMVTAFVSVQTELTGLQKVPS